MKKLKEVKGITLVALVVTVVILLILSGISIASLTGNSVYRKCITVTTNSTNYTVDAKELLSPNIDYIVKQSGRTLADNNLTIAMFPCYYTTVAYKDMWMEVNTKIMHLFLELSMQMR